MFITSMLSHVGFLEASRAKKRWSINSIDNIGVILINGDVKNIEMPDRISENIFPLYLDMKLNFIWARLFQDYFHMKLLPDTRIHLVEDDFLFDESYTSKMTSIDKTFDDKFIRLVSTKRPQFNRDWMDETVGCLLPDTRNGLKYKYFNDTEDGRYKLTRYGDWIQICFSEGTLCYPGTFFEYFNYLDKYGPPLKLVQEDKDWIDSQWYHFDDIGMMMFYLAKGDAILAEIDGVYHDHGHVGDGNVDSYCDNPILHKTNASHLSRTPDEIIALYRDYLEMRDSVLDKLIRDNKDTLIRLKNAINLSKAMEIGE